MWLVSTESAFGYRYEELMANEVRFNHEINALEKRFSSWGKTDQDSALVGKPISKLPTARDVVENLPPQVAQFEVYLSISNLILS